MLLVRDVTLVLQSCAEPQPRPGTLVVGEGGREGGGEGERERGERERERERDGVRLGVG